MKQRQVLFAYAAEQHLQKISRYLRNRFGAQGADSFVETIISDCLNLAIAAERGVLRPELGEDVRMIGVAKGRVSVRFTVKGDTVTVVGIFYGGRQH